MEILEIDRTRIYCVSCEEEFIRDSKGIEFTSGRTLCLECADVIKNLMIDYSIKLTGSTGL